MAITSFELEQFAKHAASEYLNNQTALNDSIYKIAETNNLNYEQTARVVEEANTQVYLNLFNKANPDDRYIEFPTADLKKISSARAQSEKTGSRVPYFPKYNDYFLPPNTSSKLSSISQAVDYNEKIASIIEKQPETPKGQYSELFKRLHEKTANSLKTSAKIELRLYIDKQANLLLDKAVQSIRGSEGTSVDFSEIFKTALSKYDTFVKRMIEELPKQENMSKVADVINTDHWYYKEVEKLAEMLDLYYSDDVTIEKVAKYGKVLGILGLAAPVAIGAREVSKKRELLRTSPLVLQNFPINRIK